MRVAIGCPVYERAWVLDRWFDGMQSINGHDVVFCFAVTPGSDDTQTVIQRRVLERGADLAVVSIREGLHANKRNWGNPERIETLAACRAALDELVRRESPDVFLSVDSDIVLPPNAMDLIAGLDSFDVIAPLVYLGPSTITNAFTDDRRHPIKRLPPHTGVRSVDIVCAAKAVSRRVLMDKKVKYGVSSHGEEKPWCRAAQDAGYSLGWDPNVKCKHIMSPDQLDREDARIGW